MLLKLRRWLLSALRIKIDGAILRLIQKQSAQSSILLVRLDAIGDFIIWLHAASRIRSTYVDKKIVLLANSQWADLAKEFPYWNEVISVNLKKFSRNPIYRYRLLLLVRRSGFTTSIQPAYSRAIHGDTLIRASGSPERIGSVGDDSNLPPWLKRVSDRWYTRLVRASPALMMESERNAEFMRGLTSSNFEATNTEIPKLLDLSESLKINAPYIVIFPGASSPGRRWGAENFAKLCNLMSVSHEFTTVLCGGSGDLDIGREIAAAIKTGRVSNLIGKTSLAELVEVIRGARLLVGNETSAIHIAAAVATPSICIVGGGHYGRFVPYPPHFRVGPMIVRRPMTCYGCNWQCCQPHLKGAAYPCVRDVLLDEVLAKAEGLFGGALSKAKTAS